MRCECSNSNRNGRFPDRPGFALVITVGLLVLLTVLALGMLTLSQISLRNRQAEMARGEAEVNARLALALAIGQLQLSAGPDQRITAPAHQVIASPRHPHWVGCWQSWRWAPDKTGGKPDYSQKSGKFLNWLVSSAKPSGAGDFNLASSDLAAGRPVTLVSATRAALAARYGDPALEPAPDVTVERLPVDNGKSPGSLAWAVFDENAKAPLQLTAGGDSSAGGEVAGRTAPARSRQDTLSDKLAPLATVRNLASLGTAELPLAAGGAGEIRGRFHDFTTDSAGLLANAVDGGLRVDLTSVMEAPVSLPMATALGSDTPYFTVADGAPRWECLRSHYRQYKTLSDTSLGTPRHVLSAVDLATSQSGMTDTPTGERLLPVIAKLQIVFSMVSHYAHIGDRVNFLNTKGVPMGNTNHAVPHLAYDPVVTLYNPYDVTLELDRLRVRIWDPPVGFRFRKHDMEKNTEVYYRPEMANGEFHGLARMCYQTERDPNVRKSFTLYLTDMNASAPGKKITLQPGETRVFSPWINNDWTWGWETAGGYAVRAFFDFAATTDFANRDGRTGNQFGVETVPGWNPRAGLQTDHMSYASRPAETLYDFEKQPGAVVGGYLSLRMNDEVVVEIKPVRTLPSSSTDPDFMVEVLAGVNNDYGDPLAAKYSAPKDLLRRYKFRFGNVTSEVSANPAKPVITRRFVNKDLLQKPADTGLGGKSPFAVLTMTAKTTLDPLDDGKAWLYNNPVIEGGEQITANAGAAVQSYDLRLVEMADFTTFPGIEIDSSTNRGFFGASSTAAKGVSHVPMCRVPLQPASSLGDWIPSDLICGSRLPRVTHPLGNARAHPMVPSESVSRVLANELLCDHSYLLNDALWDRYYFSTATSTGGGLFAKNTTRKSLLEGFLSGQDRLPNPRLLPVVPPASGGTATQRAASLDGADDITRSRKLAAEMWIGGAFNINSTSVDAWRAVLSSLRDRAVTGWAKNPFANDQRTPFARMSLPPAGSAESAAAAIADLRGQIRWAGFRTLDDKQISALAQEIVKEIRKRGVADKAPALSLGEFVNRRPGPASSLHALAGLLQTAIDNSGVNAAYHKLDSKSVNPNDISADRKAGVACAEALVGYSGEGSPPLLTQGDLMEGLAAAAAVRGDTFKIRAYGESDAKDGKVLSRVWCEAVVQRMPGYVDPADTADTKPSALKSNANKLAGRRFVIRSFRWLHPDEV